MKSECEKLAVDLSAYFDDELEESERAAVDAHLAECASCRGDLGKMRKLRAVLSATEAPPVPETRLIQDLMRALQRPDSQDGRELFEIGRSRPSPFLTRGR